MRTIFGRLLNELSCKGKFGTIKDARSRFNNEQLADK